MDLGTDGTATTRDMEGARLRTDKERVVGHPATHAVTLAAVGPAPGRRTC